MAFAAAARGCFALCALTLLSSAVSRADSNSLNAFLERMRTANGPVFHAHLVSTSHRIVDGVAEQDVSEAAGLRIWLRHCAASLCRGLYFDGDRGFRVNINNTALPLSHDADPYERGIRTVASLAFLDKTFSESGGRVDDGGMKNAERKPYRQLLVAGGSAIAMEVYVDPKTALIAYARDVNGDNVFAFRDYHRTGSYTLPYTIARDGRVEERYETRSAVGAPFVPPRGLVPTLLRDAQPMRTDAANALPVGTCTVAGQPVKCLLDTGNSGLSMSLELAEKLGLPSRGAYVVSGLGTYAAEVVRAGPLVVGNAQFPEANFVVLNEINRYGYDIVLGADVLANALVAIDWTNHTVAFTQNPPDADRVPLAFANFVPVVEVRLGTLATPLAVDTGDESNINLGWEYYEQHSNLFSPTTTPRNVEGVGGRSVELVGQIPQVRIGNYRLSQQPIGATKGLKGTAHGHIGALFLDHFKVVLDYSQGTMYLTPLSGDASVERAASTIP